MRLACQLRPDTDIDVIPLFSAESAISPRQTSHKLRRYDGEDIAISYDMKRCIHAEECVRGLPRVFDPGRRVWVEATQAQASEALAHLAFYVGWPNVFSALPVAKDVFEKRPK